MVFRLCFIACIFSTFPFAHAANRHEKGPLSEILDRIQTVGSHSPKRALLKTSALAWKRVGAVTFENDGTSASPEWVQSYRDTTVYNSNGLPVLRMSSEAMQGWGADSLSSVDSTMYENGRISRDVNLNYYGDSRSGYSHSYSYHNDGKTIVSNSYRWDNSRSEWIQDSRDSLVFMVDMSYSFSTSGISQLRAVYSWDYDTIGGKWVSGTYFEKLDGECTATRLVFSGKQQDWRSDSDSLVDCKFTFNFSSASMDLENVSEMIEQQRNPENGQFENIDRTTYSYTAEGYATRSEFFDWDVSSSTWVTESLQMYYPDSRGNDTLYMSLRYDRLSGEWDTSWASRQRYIYDSNGNMAEEYYSSYNSFDGTWTLSGKTVHLYAEMETQALALSRKALQAEIKVTSTPQGILFSGIDIASVALYNAAGQLILAADQKPFQEMFISKWRFSPIPAGHYFARLKTGSGVQFCKVPLIR